MYYSCLFTSKKCFGQRVIALGLWLLVWGIWGNTVWAQQSNPASQKNALPSLFASSKVLSLTEPLGIMNVPRSTAVTPETLQQEPLSSQFATWQPGMRLDTSPTQNVWLRLVLPATPEPQTWIFRIPRMTLEKATLYSAKFQEGAGWQKISAGSNLPRSEWPMRARDPTFELTTQKNQTQLFFIQLEHSFTITENVELILSIDLYDGANRLGTLNGLILGIFGILTLGSLISAWIHRSTHFCWLALFCFAVLLAQLTSTGYMSMRIWPNSVFLTQTMGWVMPLFSLAAFALFALSVSFAKVLSKAIYYSLWTVVASCALLSACVMLLPVEISRPLLNPFFAFGMLTILGSLIWISWRSQHWLWMVVVSLAPVVLSVLVRLGYNLGWIAQVELALLVGVITSGIGMLAVFTALYLHQRQQLASVYRDQALDNTDGPTGLFTERIAKARLPQILLRSKRFERSCGAIMVRWLDFGAVMSQVSVIERGRIFSHLGNRLGRLAREIDTVARAGEDQFLFLVEAPVTREDINSLASKILTTCLRPSSAMPDGKCFDVNIAVWLSNEVPANADQVFELLKTRINQMREGTQRRVQFVDTPLTTGIDSIKDPAEHAAQLVAKINSLEATQGLPTINLRPRRPDVPTSP